MAVHGKDLIEDPKATILSMCNFLGVSCSDDYLETCDSKIFKTESKTRYKNCMDQRHDLYDSRLHDEF